VSSPTHCPDEEESPEGVGQSRATRRGRVAGLKQSGAVSRFFGLFGWRLDPWKAASLARHCDSLHSRREDRVDDDATRGRLSQS